MHIETGTELPELPETRWLTSNSLKPVKSKPSLWMVNTWLANRTRTITSPQHPTLELPLGTYFMREEATFAFSSFLLYFCSTISWLSDFRESAETGTRPARQYKKYGIAFMRFLPFHNLETSIASTHWKNIYFKAWNRVHKDWLGPTSWVDRSRGIAG